MPATGNRSSASMYADPTMPNTSFTPCASSVSTNASEGVIRSLPARARFEVSVIVFMRGILQRIGFSCGRGAALRHGGRSVYIRRLDERVAERLRDRTTGHLAERDVQTVAQVR